MKTNSSKNSIGSAPKGVTTTGGHYKNAPMAPTKMSTVKGGADKSTSPAMGRMPKSGK